MKFFLTAVVLSFFLISCASKKPLVVTQKPEQPVYMRDKEPGAGYYWVEGEWKVKGKKYYWQEGKWVKQRNKEWLPGSWQRNENGWWWQAGRWIRKPVIFADLSKSREIIFE